MTVEPIRSTLSPASMEDTSLVLPSDRKQQTGQQRVLEQVKSIKRSKSKMVKTNSVPSPTSPASVTEYSEPKFQFSPTNMSGTLFKCSGSNMTASHSIMTGRSLSVRNTVRRQTQNSQWEPQMNWNAQSQSNGLRRGDSDPAMNKAGSTITQQSKGRSATVRYTRATGQSMRIQENNQLAQSQTIIKPSLSQSQTVRKVTVTKSKSEPLGASGAEGSLPNITLQDAVEYLSHSDISLQLSGASFIQHQTFTEDQAKQEVWRLGGIPALIQLLKSDNSQLHQTAAAALRNLVFKDNNNKLEVDSCEGIEAILTLLGNTNVTETHQQLTGLLWNLSSADKLKTELIKNALPLLTETIVVPYSVWTDVNTNRHIDPEVFYNTTGCLRNLSCAREEERISMRSCPQLIDSLVTYVQTQKDHNEPDDKSVENCVCILHNLSYQLEKEASDHFEQFSVLDERPNENNKKKSLFSPKSPKSSKTQKDFNFPATEKENPEGVNWLYHQKSLQLYLSLVGCSQNEATLEACCGALQNLTASKSPLSTLMSQSIIEKLQGLSVISPLLKSANPGLQKTTMSLVGNMSRVSSLRGTMVCVCLLSNICTSTGAHKNMWFKESVLYNESPEPLLAAAKEILPMASYVLSSVTPEMDGSDSTIATACRVMQTLMLAEPDSSKTTINVKLIDTLSTLSSNMLFETGRKAAGFLLWSMWEQKDIQNVLKKQGMKKDTFVNAVTATAYKDATRMKIS